MTSDNTVSQCETIDMFPVTELAAHKAVFNSVLTKLEAATGLELCIAGGAVRDALHGKQSKDLDVEVLNFEDTYNNTYVAERFEHIETLLLKVGAKDVEIFNEYEGASMDAHVDVILKFKLEGYDIDLILRDTHPKTPDELVELYDMNLNQVAFHKGRFLIIKPIVGNKIVPTGKLLRIKRVKHLMSKYPEYDFSAMFNYLEEDPDNKKEPVSQCETPFRPMTNAEIDNLL